MASAKSETLQLLSQRKSYQILVVSAASMRHWRRMARLKVRIGGLGAEVRLGRASEFDREAREAARYHTVTPRPSQSMPKTGIPANTNKPARRTWTFVARDRGKQASDDG